MFKKNKVEINSIEINGRENSLKINFKDRESFEKFSKKILWKVKFKIYAKRMFMVKRKGDTRFLTK